MCRAFSAPGQYALLALSFPVFRVASSVVCWGQGDGETSVPEGLGRVVQLVAGWAYTCALSESGAVTCWGRLSGWGLSSQSGIARLFAGETHVCGLTAGGLARCWGANSHNQTEVPADLPPVTDLALSTFSTCALTHQGTVACWGRTATQAPNLPGVAVGLALGWFHGCAMHPVGAVSCWGSQQDVALPLNASDPPMKLQARSLHSCSLSVSGLVHCWDGRGLTEVPQFRDRVADLTLGDEHRCARTTAGLVACWGTISSVTNYGQLDIPGDLGSVAQLVAGPWHTCALTEAGAAKCWGMDITNQSHVPEGLGVLSGLALGAYHTCAIRQGHTGAAMTTTETGGTSTPTSTSTRTEATEGVLSTPPTTSYTIARASSQPILGSPLSEGFLQATTSTATVGVDSVVQVHTEIGGMDYSALEANESIRAAVIDVVEDGLVGAAQIPRSWIQSWLRASGSLRSRRLRAEGGVLVESVIQLTSQAAARNLTLQLQVEGSTFEEAVLAGLRLIEGISEVLLPCAAITVSLTVAMHGDTAATAAVNTIGATGCGCSTETISPLWQLLSLFSMLAAFAVAGLAFLRGRQQLPPGSTGPLPDEREFQGKLGHLDVAVVSCPGAADEDFGQGEIYSLVIRMQGLPVSVVYFGKAHINEFWHIYTRALKNFAVGKKYLVVLTRQNGDIGNIQKQEVSYLAGCDGRKLGDLPPRPLFRGKEGVHLLAMTFRELVAWWRLNFDETSLGQELPMHVRNHHVGRLPTIGEMEQRFEDLVMGGTTQDACDVH